MASFTTEGIQTSIAPYRYERPDASAEDTVTFKQYHPDFKPLVGAQPLFSLLLSSDESSGNPFYHNGCVYIPERDELYIMSDLLQSTSSSRLPVILISRITLTRTQSSVMSDSDSFPVPEIGGVKWMKLRPPPSMPMPACAIRYQKGILFCSQGELAPDTGGLWYMPLGKPPVAVLTSFFGRPFNSIQNVVQDRDGGLWFTDSASGFEQEIRPKPQLPNHVYRFDPQEGDLRVVADGFGRPTGIAMSPDQRTLYITDTAAAHPDGSIDQTLPATIYAFDIIERSGSPSLANRRVFAYALVGVPTAVHCDQAGNVYASCGDGIEVWSPGGMVLGLIEVPGAFSLRHHAVLSQPSL
ncbi:hypothetical protein DL769_008166 [Monosporascus sp. CRB-8-3]|nr:hypothetical protein DL769_008166 [Monosporascus sp. CRB-8-3]